MPTFFPIIFDLSVQAFFAITVFFFVVHLSDCSFVYFLSLSFANAASCLCAFLSFSSFTPFCSSVSSSLILLGGLWFLVGVLFLQLYFFGFKTLSLLLFLQLKHMIFLYDIPMLPLLYMHCISLPFHLALYIGFSYIFSSVVSVSCFVGFPAIETEISFTIVCCFPLKWICTD